jgi:transcriptional regulator with XRE-family HTH domain
MFAALDTSTVTCHNSAVEGFYEEFGRRLRAARGKMSQAELGRRVGLSRASIVNVEAGRQRVPLHMLQAFADALTVSPESLLPVSTGEGGLVRPELVSRLEPEDRRLVETVVERAKVAMKEDIDVSAREAG